MSQAGLGCAMIAAAFMTGCFVGDEPLSPARSSHQDPKLVGEWRCVSAAADGDELALVHVTRLGSDQYEVEFAERGKKADKYRGHISIVSGKALLNLQEFRDGKPIEGWVFVRYDELRTGLLDIRLIEDDLLEGAKDAKEVRDSVQRNIEDPKLYQSFCVCLRVERK